jgi:asparagine synthase (glutamine-hydrolysing)
MCGIAGICHLSGPAGISLDSIKKMVAVQRHRGPDETGIYIDDRIALGQARLSIIDLSSGTQPIHNEDKSLWIIYNGEVFNYLELRRDLQEKGHRFYTTCDTEVILHLFEEKGPACLNDMNGQFALAIWNTNTRELFLARDRVGIRPLHYTIHDDRLIFASEIKAIFTLPEIPRTIDPVAMDQIFTFWTTLKGRTVFTGIRELPPGHYLRMSQGSIKIDKYWDLPYCRPDDKLKDTPDEIAEQIGDLLHDAVRLRLRADVPVGCYLSGGLDSSGLTAKVVRDFNSNVKTFGIRFQETAFDEGPHQNLMVKHLKVNHHEMLATNRLIAESFPDVIRHCEKPILRTAPAPLFLLSKLVNESNIKVVLTGEGADEFFGGYNIFRETKVRRFWARQPDSTSRPELIGQLYPYIFKDPKLKMTLQSFFAKGLYNTTDPFFSHAIRWANTGKIKGFFSPELRDQIGSYSPYDDLKQDLPAGFDTWDSFSKAQYLEASIFLSNYLLSSQGDRVAMAHSLEIRVPYLDFRLMEFMAKVPAKWKLLGLDEKHILKKAFKNTLPPEIVNRPKNPYRAPISQSLLAEDAKCADDFLSEGSLQRTGLFDLSKVKGLVAKLRRTTQPGEIDGMALTGIVSSQILFDHFIEHLPEVSPTNRQPDLLIDCRNS